MDSVRIMHKKVHEQYDTEKGTKVNLISVSHFLLRVQSVILECCFVNYYLVTFHSMKTFNDCEIVYIVEFYF